MTSFRVEAELADETIAGAVLGRVVGILGARVALPIDPGAPVEGALVKVDEAVLTVMGEKLPAPGTACWTV